ncbi:metal-sulfur cluster assembly factor [Oscillatoria laete-virens NRMC-F 0139]|nr:metal-sulfur cluster assembly factor [Oscillatoria laete-virens NRMC-F 0139]
MEILRKIHDPELGLNIVDLGLVYEIKTGSNSITVVMTLTTPGCPMHEAITEGVRHILHYHTDAERIDVEVVWTPLWNPSMISDEGKKHLNITS